MKRWIALLGLALVGMPTVALAQGQEAEEMAGEAAHEAHEMAEGHEAMHAKMSEEARPEIEARVVEWEQAFNAGDFAAVAAFYTEDAVLLPPGTDAVEGPAAIQEMFATGFAGLENLQMDLQTTELFAVPGGALEIGTYTMEADGEHKDHGKYMVAWTKTDDGWKIARDIWNSSMGGGE